MDPYHERQRERAEFLRALLPLLCAARAKGGTGDALLAGFTPEPARDEPSDWYAALAHADGRRIGLHLSAEYLKGQRRLAVTGTYPPDEYGRYKALRDWYVTARGETEPRISVRADRAPAVIAADIARRFLVDYSRLYLLCAARRAAALTYVAGRAAAVGAVLDRIGDAGTLDEGRDERDPHVHVTMTDTCYGDLWPDRVELRSCTPALVADIAGVIARHVRADARKANDAALLGPE